MITRKVIALCVVAGIGLLSLAHSAYARDTYQWNSVAIGGGGYVLDVCCHPKQKNLVYIRTDVGGFYRWDAPHTRWIPLTDCFPRTQENYYGGEGLALDPADPNIVYIAAGKYGWDSPPGTIFKSIDQGKIWTKLPLDLKMGGNEDERASGQRLVVSPFRSSLLLFGSRSDGLWRSQNAGASWSRVSSFPGAPKPGIGLISLAFSPDTRGVVYVAAFGDGVYRSEDDGVTWRKTPGGPAQVERLMAAPDGTLYATHGQGVSRYAAGAWTAITPSGAQGGFGGLSIDKRDPRDLIVAGQSSSLSLYRSHDGGTTWQRLRSEVHSSVPWYSGSMKQIQYVSGLTFDPCVPGRIWLTDWYATYHTDDLSADPVVFTNEERGHEELVVFSLAAPTRGLPLLSGVADVDGFAHPTLNQFPAHGLGDYYGGKGPTFGDTDQIAWCPTAPEHLARVGLKRWDNTGGGALSQDGGRTWSGFPSWDAHIMPGRIAISATNPDNMVVLRIGAGAALTTRDGGVSWQSVSGLPNNLVPDVWAWQVPLVGDGAHGGVFYAFRGGTLYRSDDSGAHFAAIKTGLPSNGAVSLQSVPGMADTLWLALGDAGLYATTDGGQTVRAVAGVRQASLFAAGRAAPGAKQPALYLYGTLADGRTGIFRSLDRGVSWKQIDDPQMPIGDVPNSMAASFQTFGLVFVGTNGRGIYYGMPQTRSAAVEVSVPADDAEATPLPVEIAPTNPQIRYFGRFTAGESGGPRCSWSASSMKLRFQGSGLVARLEDSGGSDAYEVIVDGKDTGPLKLKGGSHLYSLFTASASGEHTVELVKRTEAFFGTTRFAGVQLSRGGKLLPLPSGPHRRIEVIGDSISCGYGNEAKSQKEHFSSDTENAYLTYGAIAARALDAEYTCVAWSGRTMWPKNTMGEIYDRILPTTQDNTWDFDRWKPDVVVINLGTNDFAGGTPDRKAWTDGYKAFLARVRKNYPKAVVYCATSPMMFGAAYDTEKAYLEQIVQDENQAGDRRVRLLIVPTQDGSNGFGADWHPSVKTHQVMAEKLIATLRQDMGWK